MEVKSVRIVLIDEDSKQHSFSLTYKEVSVMIGALNVIHDLRNCDAIMLAGDEWATDAFGQHMSLIAQEFDHDECVTLLWRLKDFATDKGLI